MSLSVDSVLDSVPYRPSGLSDETLVQSDDEQFAIPLMPGAYRPDSIILSPSNATQPQLQTIRSETSTSPYTIKQEDSHACQCLQRRNLVVCLDGTANQFNIKNSNVVELYSRLIKDKDQMTYYNSGIGTYVKNSESWFSWDAWKQSFHHALDIAIATSFKDKILGAYQWLSENYEDGDRIFLFGFSRGAYQVRVIAGMIEKVGLLHKGNNEQIPFAYELYSKTTTTRQQATNETAVPSAVPHTNAQARRDDGSADIGHPQAHVDPDEELRTHFKKVFSRPSVKVHFVGAWDTVSSIGVLRGPSLPETTNGMKHVCIFRHALALDELRVKFLPEYANGGDGPSDAGKKVKEVWFAGSHSDIGGGNVENRNLNKFGPALRWMSYEAIEAGLRMVPNTKTWDPLTLNDSMSWGWELLERWPFSRLSYKGPGDLIRWTPHRSSPRIIKPHQMIHESVFREMDRTKAYQPKASLFADTPRASQNNDEQNLVVQDEMQKTNRVEKDPYLAADAVLQELRVSDTENINSAQINVLLTLISSETGRCSIREFPNSLDLLIRAARAVVEAREEKDEEKTSSHLRATTIDLVRLLQIFESVPEGYTGPSADELGELWSKMEDILAEDDYKPTFSALRSVFGDKVYLKVYIACDTLDALEIKKEEILTGNLRFVKLMDTLDGADLTLQKDGTSIGFDILQGPWATHGMKKTLVRPCRGLQDVRCILEDMLYFYLHFFRVAGPEPLRNVESTPDTTATIQGANEVSVECVECWDVESRVNSAARMGENLNKDGCINIYMSDEDGQKRYYEYRITNNTDLSLYLWVFCFDITTSSIFVCYQPQIEVGAQPCIAPYGNLPHALDLSTLSAFSHPVEPGGANVSFLAIYYSTQYQDLSYIEHTMLDGLQQGWEGSLDTLDSCKTYQIPLVRRRQKPIGDRIQVSDIFMVNQSHGLTRVLDTTAGSVLAMHSRLLEDMGTSMATQSQWASETTDTTVGSTKIQSSAISTTTESHSTTTESHWRSQTLDTTVGPTKLGMGVVAGQPSWLKMKDIEALGMQLPVTEPSLFQ